MPERIPEHGGLVALVHCDLGSIIRCRSVPTSAFETEPSRSVGWVPSAHARPPFGPSVQPNPFGPFDDVRLKPDLATRATVAAEGGSSALDLVICDVVQIDGQPWGCCPRTFLRDALEALQHELGSTLLASFEHEFQLVSDAPVPPPLSLDAQRWIDPFPTLAMAALEEAGIEPERFIPESAPRQYEIPLIASEGAMSADRSVILRAVLREVARRLGLHVTFTALLDPAHPGNGVHIHLSLIGDEGENLFYDAARPGCLSALGGSFAAGILAHARALTAVTAPSPVSAARLQPGRRSAGAVCLGQRNREALLRLPPLITADGMAPSGQLRLEYRGADAAANPYLALGALVCAGVDGVRRELPAPPLVHVDHAPPNDDASTLASLPQTLADSLHALDSDSEARAWVPPELYRIYAALKRAEIDASEGQALEELCLRYADVY
jgi:glutamine synthetase